MNETLILALAWVAGGGLGAIFFGGLWWTVRACVSSKWAPLWFSGSLLLRTSLVLAGFYVVSARQGDRLLLCLLGFAMARFAVTWLTRTTEKPACLKPES